MRILMCSGEKKAWRRTGLLSLVAVLVLQAPVTTFAINAVASSSVDAKAGLTSQTDVPGIRYSEGVAEVLRMAEAKVDPEVIKAYVKSSSTAFNLNAAEIIALKDRGISSEILTAMIQRGSELRRQAAQNVQPSPNAAAQAAPPPMANPYAPAPAYDYGVQSAYPGYAYSYPAYSYSYPDYSYYPNYSYYPYYWPSYSVGYLGGGYYGGFGYGYGWPSCWPSAYWGAWPYRGYGYCGYRYPGYGWGRGYGYGYNHGNRGYYNAGYHSGAYRPGYAGYGGRAIGYGGHSAAYGGRAGGFQSGGGVARPASFGGQGGGFSGRGGGMGGHGGGMGGHAGGRGR